MIFSKLNRVCNHHRHPILAHLHSPVPTRPFPPRLRKRLTYLVSMGLSCWTCHINGNEQHKYMTFVWLLFYRSGNRNSGSRPEVLYPIDPFVIWSFIKLSSNDPIEYLSVSCWDPDWHNHFVLAVVN